MATAYSSEQGSAPGTWGRLTQACRPLGGRRQGTEQRQSSAAAIQAGMADRRCACHSHRKEKRCCGPFHAGKLPETPTQLMRSRFAAYARGLHDYVIETTDPDGPRWVANRAAWIASMQQFTANTRFSDLRILAADGDTVTFHAVLEQMGQDASFTERSVFIRRDGRWLYHSGDPSSPVPQ